MTLELWARWVARPGWACLALLGALAACGDDAPPAPAGPDLRAALQTPVQFKDPVALVDGRPIGAEVLARMVARPGNERTKQQLLDDLITGELLYQEALQKGYDQDPDVQLLYRKLMVQRMLEDEVEGKTAPSSIPAAEVQRRYEEQHGRFHVPELRAADHLLALPDRKKFPPGTEPRPVALYDACARLMAQIHEDLRARGEVIQDAKGLEAVKARWDDKRPPDVELLVESLPPAAQRGRGEPGSFDFLPSLDESFADAMFKLKVGERSEPVSGDFGTHIVVLRRVVPPVDLTLAEAEVTLREEMSQERRPQAWKEFLAPLNGRAQLRVNDGLWERTMKAEEGAAPAP